MKYKAYLFDLDGTLFRGTSVIPGAPEVLAELRRRGALVRFLTNNSSQTRAQFAAKLQGMGFEAHEEEAVGSGYGTAKLLAKEGVRSVFLVGEPGLVQTFREAGIAATNAPANGIVTPNAPDDVDAVVVGICRHFDYPLLNAAMQRIRRGARFVATNPDTTYPMEGDTLVPGAGSLVAAVAACSEQEPLVVGKPKPYLVEMVLGETGLRPEEALVVGDRLDTDIECGKAAGCPTFLVLTGVTKTAPEGQWSGESLEELLSRPS
ncbi:MAG TPA: phosphoglycolate/pyridoxal phosphate family phosphatase [Fimbriimonas sp.]